MATTTRFNKFGATAAEVVALYPGTVLADYDGGGSNGQATIDGVLHRMAREAAASLTPDIYKQMTQVQAEEIVIFASEGQTSASVGISPVLSGSVHLWKYPPIAQLEKTIWPTADTYYSEFYYRKPVVGYNELILGEDYTVSGTVITFSGDLLAKGDRIYASYNVNIEDDAFTMRSIADMVIIGAAAELGARLYSESNQEWKLVTDYRDRWNQWKEDAAKGAWIPDEIRELDYFAEVERTSNEVSSVRLYRG